MTTWNLQETYSLIRAVFGKEQEALARESMRSVIDRKAFSSYHFGEVLRLTKALERKHLADLGSFLEIHVEGAEVKLAAFEGYMIKAGAHSIAAVQSLHALPDIFGHAIYFASGQNLQPQALAESDISNQKVAGCLKRDIGFKVLATPLYALQSGLGWSHLAAVCNISKHRNVIRAMYSEDWTGSRANKRELQVSSFVRNGKEYPAISLRELLEPEYERLMRSIIAIDHELKACLRTLKI
jgi:hypothetical protein